MKRSLCRTAGFSLVELTLALGVASFCLLAIFGLLPTSLKTQQASIQQTTANQIISTIFSDLRADLILPPGQYRHLEEDSGYQLHGHWPSAGGVPAGSVTVHRSIGRRTPGGNIFASATGVDERPSRYRPAGCVARRVGTGSRSSPKLHGGFARLARLVTTGAVITEAFYFLSDVRDGPANLAAFLDASATDVRDAFSAEALACAVALMNKYADVPMDFPDATLVWIAESSGTDRILTLHRRGFHGFALEITADSNCCWTCEPLW